MKRLYLIRHGHPDFPLDAHMCLGRTDTPLGPLGRMQACLLGQALAGRHWGAVFASPLLRCRETAAPLNGAPRLVEALAEQDMGPWDGLDFTQIGRDWPELLARRGAEPLLVPPGAEPLEQVQRRVVPAITACAEESPGDLALVAHASVIQAFLAWVRQIPLEESRPLRPPYTGCTVLEYENGRFTVLREAQVFCPPLTGALAEKLLEAADPGERVQAHCRAVARQALRLADALPQPPDRELLYAAALLHDVARAREGHAREGARWLEALGYPAAAALVAQHHDHSGEALDAAGLLYLADKRVQEDQVVSLEERFAASGAKCRDEEAQAAHARRYRAAMELKREWEAQSGLTLT